ncbi:hypothetical protein JCM19237_167 [Photobacterium aphoticum]|uniref:ABC3 transporter permease C-terminal domain-containing protein n=1 Tax=Photobacterium aphoticum TaxID=754436 RepID=A0A090R0T0_9GAMM|nr:hypothetical protein JCM19237_167 [Photobacterium aphoticum]
MATRIQGIMQQISLSLSVLAGLGVVSGLLLVMTLLRLSMAQRKLEIKLYRTLGASRQRITATVWGEYGIMALIAGIMAAIGRIGGGGLSQMGLCIAGHRAPLGVGRRACAGLVAGGDHHSFYVAATVVAVTALEHGISAIKTPK